MKVRAIEGCHRNLTAGKIYDVVSISEGGAYWRVVDDNGFTDGYIPDVHFEVVEDEPKIEVVSEEAEEELENIIKELEGLNVRAWGYGTYEDIHVHVSEINALDKAIEILKGMRG